MKYPFTPALLDSFPDEIQELYNDLELRLLEMICSRLKISGKLNEVTIQAIKALISHGIDIKEIKKEIEKVAKISEKKLDILLQDVVKLNQQYYTELVTLADVTKPDVFVSQADLKAIETQTKGTLQNITQSVGFMSGGKLLTPGQVYRKILDNAVMDVQSSAMSYQESIYNSVRELAGNGLTYVRYEKRGKVRYDHADVAVRRAILTGVNQLCSKYSEQSMKYLNTDLVEVTAHSGARDKKGSKPWDSHKDWQGKVYRWKKQ